MCLKQLREKLSSTIIQYTSCSLTKQLVCISKYTIAKYILKVASIASIASIPMLGVSKVGARLVLS